jgi:hypothetical protein
MENWIPLLTGAAALIGALAGVIKIFTGRSSRQVAMQEAELLAKLEKGSEAHTNLSEVLAVRTARWKSGTSADIWGTLASAMLGLTILLGTARWVVGQHASTTEEQLSFLFGPGVTFDDLIGPIAALLTCSDSASSYSRRW